MTIKSKKAETHIYLTDGRALCIEHDSVKQRHQRTCSDVSSQHVLHSIARICIFGCGATGYRLAQEVALNDTTTELWLFDPDSVEVVNLNRLPLPTAYVGWNKAEALACEIARFRPATNVQAFPTAFVPTDIEGMTQGLCTSPPPSQGELAVACRQGIFKRARVSTAFGLRFPLIMFVDCTDSATFHRALYLEYQKLRDRLADGPPEVRYLRTGYDGISHITIATQTSDFRIGDEPAGYDVVPSWGAPAALTAMLAGYVLMLTGAANAIKAQGLDARALDRLRPEIRIGTKTLKLFLKRTKEAVV